MERTGYYKNLVVLIFTVHISRVHVYKKFITSTSYGQLYTAIIIYFYFTYYTGSLLHRQKKFTKC